ncbi:MAG: SLBB domain-containing protein, partial [Fibrobacterales bacterium]
MTCIMRALSMRHTLKMIVLTLIVSVLSSYGALTITSGDVIRVEIPQEHEQSTTYTVTSDETITFLFGTPLYLGGTPVTKLSAMVKKHLSRFYTNTDLIEVTVLKKMVRAKIQGHIGSPGWYSLPIGSDIQDLIKAANGMLDGAVIDRLLIKKHNKPSTQTYSLKVFLENGQDSALHRLEQGDIIFVPMSPIMGTVQRSLMSYTPPPDETRDNIINVLGEVYAPGSYEVNTDVTVLDMIAMAGGPKEPGNPNKVMDLENIRVIRTINGTADVFRFNMNSYFQTGDARLLIQIEAGDNILIPSKKADVEDET